MIQKILTSLLTPFNVHAIKIYLIIIFSNLIFAFSYTEIGIGIHQPQSKFSKYVDTGISLNATVSKLVIDIPFIYYDVGFRYIHILK